MRCGVAAVLAAVLAAVVAAGDSPGVAVAPMPGEQFWRRRIAHHGEFPYLALVANMWGECSASILAPIAVLGPSSCLPTGFQHNGRVEAGNSRFFTMKDFGDKPAQARIIERYIKLKPETPGADSLMIIKLLKPFEFTTFVQAIPIATERRSPPLRAQVVGYGMGSARWRRRQLTALWVGLAECRPEREGALCVATADPHCAPDHGAAVVAGGRLLAVAGKDSLCAGAVLLVAPHSETIAQLLRSFTDKGCVPRAGGPNIWPDSNRRSAAVAWRRRRLPPWAATALALLAASALS